MRSTILVILLFSVVCSLVFVSKRNADKRADFMQGKFDVQYNRLANALLLQTECSNSTVISNIQLTGFSQQKTSISDVISKHGWTLIYRFASTDCFECVNTQLSLLKEKFPKKTNNIIIVATYPSVNDLNIVHKEYDLRYSYFRTDANNLNPTADRLNTPYFFLVDSTLKIRNLFIPEKEIPDLTRRYFNYIENLL